MLLVRTTIGPSQIHGIGLFAAEPIVEGQRVWEFNSAIDRVVGHDELEALPQVAQEFVLRHAFLDEDRLGMILCGDHAIYFNHAENPNTVALEHGNVATRNIAVGEEITENYRVFGRGCCNIFLFETH